MRRREWAQLPEPYTVVQAMTTQMEDPNSDLTSLFETAHLLRSRKNAERLLTALRRATLRLTDSQPLDDLRRELGLDCEDQE